MQDLSIPDGIMTIDRGTVTHLGRLLEGSQAVQEVHKECIFIAKDQCGLSHIRYRGETSKMMLRSAAET